MNIPNRKTIIILIVIVISILLLAGYCHNYQNQLLMEKIFSRFPEGLFDPNDPSVWEIIDKTSEQAIKDIETPGFKEREQEKMKRLEIGITITDEMISERYFNEKKELDFARKQLTRLIRKRKNK